MLAYLLASKHATNQHLQAFQRLTSKLFEANKMQTYDTAAAHPAQNHPTQSSGIFIAVLVALGAFLFYAIQQHLITDAFVYLMSQFFDSFSIKSTSIIADIAILIFFGLALFGLFCLFKFFFVVTVSVVIIVGFAAAFLAHDTPSHHTLKDVLVKENRATESENVGG
jgi:4-hydroxybenzoate polyprenyltransferase